MPERRPEPLAWSPVAAWRMARHALTRPLPSGSLVAAAARTGGIHAQVMSAAELALATRADSVSPGDVRQALWRDRTLVKTWAMRATLHLLPSEDLPLWSAARSAHRSRNWDRYFGFFGIPPKQAAAFVAEVPQVLGGSPMTREELASEMGKRLGAPSLARRLLQSSWGSLWKPSAWRGDLCFGPSRGRSATFVHPRAWIGAWREIDPGAALLDVVRRYLAAYGPAAPDDFARWWGSTRTTARRAFRSLEDELASVVVEGRPAFALPGTLVAVRRAAPSGAVRLLPLFDAYVMGLTRGVERLLPEQHRRAVFRPQGWVSAVLLVDGRVAGTWTLERGTSRSIVRVETFARPGADLRRKVEREVRRIGVFLGAEAALEIRRTD